MGYFSAPHGVITIKIRKDILDCWYCFRQGEHKSSNIYFFSSIQSAIPIASMSQGDQNELSQAEEIKNAEIYFLIILEAQRPKSRFH